MLTLGVVVYNKTVAAVGSKYGLAQAAAQTIDHLGAIPDLLRTNNLVLPTISPLACSAQESALAGTLYTLIVHTRSMMLLRLTPDQLLRPSGGQVKRLINEIHTLRSLSQQALADINAMLR